ncbi:MAG: methyl-coenzyme M reductase operon protein D [Methanolinea sp.]|jgi:methyl-coenzyme M reductase subunit D|nr:methyl-coenzyme M reductase operon protein D [Methanolinea sp.]
MTDVLEFPQCRIVPMRLLGADTTRRLLDRLATIHGVRRILLNGQNLPSTVPYGPSRGLATVHPQRKKIRVLGTEVDLRVQVGSLVLEVEDRSVIDEVRSLCGDFFTDFSCSVQEGRFMKTRPSLSDYARYGPLPDPAMIGLSDPKQKEDPVFLTEPTGCRGDL